MKEWLKANKAYVIGVGAFIAAKCALLIAAGKFVHGWERLLEVHLWVAFTATAGVFWLLHEVLRIRAKGLGGRIEFDPRLYFLLPAFVPGTISFLARRSTTRTTRPVTAGSRATATCWTIGARACSAPQASVIRLSRRSALRPASCTPATIRGDERPSRIPRRAREHRAVRAGARPQEGSLVVRMGSPCVERSAPDPMLRRVDSGQARPADRDDPSARLSPRSRAAARDGAVQSMEADRAA